MQAEIAVADVLTFETKNGNKRYVVRDEGGDEYTTFGETIGNDALTAKGRRARIEFHKQQRGEYTNVYLDSIEPLEAVAEDDTDPAEAGWRTAVDAAPWLVGDSDEGGVSADEMFEKLKPFKDRIAEDIREDDA